MTEALIMSVIDSHPLNMGVPGRDWVADPDNIAVVEGDDFTLFEGIGEGHYEIHVVYNSSRGRAAIDRVTEALDQVFHKHRASVVFGLIPRGRKDVEMLARWTGFRFLSPMFTPYGWCEKVVMTRYDWMKDRRNGVR